QHAPGGGQHGWRRLDLRVTEREVEDIVRSALLLEARALLEHATDPRGPGEVVGDGGGDDHGRQYRADARPIVRALDRRRRPGHRPAMVRPAGVPVTLVRVRTRARGWLGRGGGEAGPRP